MINYKTFAWFSNTDWGVLPRSFFYFETLLWIILIGFPILVFILYRYKVITFKPYVKILLSLFTFTFSLLSFFWTSSVWILAWGVLLMLIIWKLAFITRQGRWPLCLILMFCWGLTLYGSFFESQRLVVRGFDLEIDSFPSMKIALVADFHIGPYKKEAWVAKVVDQINQIEDLDGVFIPGDFMYGASHYYAPFLRPLVDINAPVYLTLGNHDHHTDPDKNKIQSRHINQQLQDFDLSPLNNASVYDEGLNLNIVGVDDNDLGYHDLTQAFRDLKKENAGVILLAHSPDIMDELKSYQSDETSYLVLTGHTHCGQIRFPPFGALPLTIPTFNGKKYEKHYYREGDTHLFITCGVGEVGPRGRLFNPPEIVVLEINTMR